MKATEFCFWLQGFFELGQSTIPEGEQLITNAQARMIAKHLALVFKHDIDPTHGSSEKQAELQAIHDSHPTTAGIAGNDNVIARC